MTQERVEPSSITENDKHRIKVAEDETKSSSPLLLLPSEVRVIIYRWLFKNQTVTIHRPRSSVYKNPCTILQTCRLCYLECLPIFYELATITLRQDAFLYNLRRRIGAENMARIHNIVVAGFDRTPGKAMATYLPESLRKLVIKWKGGTSFYDVTARNNISDAEIRNILDRSRADYLNSCVKDLWTKNPKLQIYLDAIVGDDPETQDATYVRPSEKRYYIIVTVELVKASELKGWSWGHIERVSDSSMVEEEA